MKSEAWLKRSTLQLQEAGIETARLDALILLEDVLGKSRAWVLAHPEREITGGQLQVLAAQLTRRAVHEPLAYIRGKTEFYGHTFLCSKNTLVPRPESEAIIELSKELILNNKIIRVADIGAGSGCLGLTLKLEFPALHIDLYDIDDDALAAAKQNAQYLGVEAHFIRSDLLMEYARFCELMVANLPYVPTEFPVNKAALHEPAVALFSGEDGLDHYQEFWAQIGSLPRRPLFIVTESFPAQHQMNTQLALGAGYRLTKTTDFAQQFER